MASLGSTSVSSWRLQMVLPSSDVGCKQYWNTDYPLFWFLSPQCDLQVGLFNYLNQVSSPCNAVNHFRGLPCGLQKLLKICPRKVRFDRNMMWNYIINSLLEEINCVQDSRLTRWSFWAQTSKHWLYWTVAIYQRIHEHLVTIGGQRV